jgi:two-component system, NarL family, nitrate/nitrite response regulator NarL
MTRVLIGSDIRIYREGLVEAISRVDDLHLQDAVGSVDDLVTRAVQVQPIIVVLDASMPGCYSAIRTIRVTAPEALVLAIGVEETDTNVLSLIDSGIHGYVSKEASLQELVRAIDAVARGEVACPGRIVASLFREIARRRPEINGDGIVRLTSRERQILELIDQRLSNKEIARALHISLSTVKNHVHNILAKRQVHRRVDAAASSPHAQLANGADPWVDAAASTSAWHPRRVLDPFVDRL